MLVNLDAKLHENGSTDDAGYIRFQCSGISMKFQFWQFIKERDLFNLV